MQREERKEADTGPEEVPAGERAGTGELADREGYAGGAGGSQLRQETGILPGVPVDIEADEDGVHIRKHVPTCHFCGTVDDVKTVCGIEICRGCAEKIMEEFKG